MHTIIMQHDYPVTPARLWAVATDCGALDRVMRGRALPGDAPPDPMVAGRRLDLRISVFGLTPGLTRPHVLEIVECDNARKILRITERGTGKAGWRHTLAVTPTLEGSRLTERIELAAGLLTPLLVLWMRHLFALRHQRRLDLLSGETP